MIVVITVISATDPRELADSGSPLSIVAEAKYGAAGAMIIAVIALFSTSNSLLSNMLGSSRVIYGMAEDTKRLKFLAFVSQTKNTGLCFAFGGDYYSGIFIYRGH